MQIIADVGGMTTAEADEIRRVFVKVKNGPLLARYKTRFMEGATRQGVTPDIAERIWAKINGHYMFPESHSYAFGINAYQAAWLKCYYPVEFFTALFNNLPMGFYPTEVIKQDSKRFGVPFLNPDINKSHVNCIPYGERVLLGFRFVKDVGAKLAASILEERERNGIFGSVGDFVQRAIMKPAALQSLVMAGTFDAMQSNRRLVLWETGLYSGSLRRQLPLPFIMDDDVPDLSDFSPYQRALSEYAVLGIYPKGHLMEFLRPGLEGVQTTAQVELAPEGRR